MLALEALECQLQAWRERGVAGEDAVVVLGNRASQRLDRLAATLRDPGKGEGNIRRLVAAGVWGPWHGEPWRIGLGQQPFAGDEAHPLPCRGLLRTEGEPRDRDGSTERECLLDIGGAP